MCALAKATSQPTGQVNAGLSEFVAQAIRGGERLLPAFPAASFEQVILPRFFFE